MSLDLPRHVVTRRAVFSAAHRLCRTDWDLETNQRVFGDCSKPGGHGHNYVVEVSVTGPIDVETGMVVDFAWLKQVIDEQIIRFVDHHNLNEDVPFLQGVVPTTENLAQCFWDRLHDAIGSRARLMSVRVVETDNNSASYGLL